MTLTPTTDPRWYVGPFDPDDAAPEGGEHRGRFPDADMYASDCTGDDLASDADLTAEALGLATSFPPAEVPPTRRRPCSCADDAVDHPEGGPCQVHGCLCHQFVEADPGVAVALNREALVGVLGEGVVATIEERLEAVTVHVVEPDGTRTGVPGIIEEFSDGE